MGKSNTGDRKSDVRGSALEQLMERYVIRQSLNGDVRVKKTATGPIVSGQ